MVKMNRSQEGELIGKRLLSLLIVSGVTFSGISFFMLDDGAVTNTSEAIIEATSITESKSEVSFVQHGGVIEPEVGFVQQGEVIAPDAMPVSNTENFDNLKFPSTNPTKDFVLLGNKATLFADKDSFIREGVMNTNEGGNEIIRVMGTESTNNRALLAFSQIDIDSVSAGKTLQSASINLYVTNSDGKWDDGQYLNIHKLRSNWDEGTGINAPFANLGGSDDGVSWNCSTEINCDAKWNGGNFVVNPTDTVFISNQVLEGYWIKYDVTADVLDYLSGSANYGWIIMKSDEDSPGRINFASRDAQSNIPELVLVFS